MQNLTLLLIRPEINCGFEGTSKNPGIMNESFSKITSKKALKKALADETFALFSKNKRKNYLNLMGYVFSNILCQQSSIRNKTNKSKESRDFIFFLKIFFFSYRNHKVTEMHRSY